MTGRPGASEVDAFGPSRERVEEVLGWLGSVDNETTGLEHAELEAALDVRGRELLRQFFQDHLDLSTSPQKYSHVTTIT